MKINHKEHRRERAFMEANGQLGKPFTQQRALNKVFGASNGLWSACSKHFKDKPGSRPGRIFRDKVMGGVRTLQALGR